MKSKFIVTEDLVRAYWNLFVNRLAYTVQSPVPHAETGKHYYYRPKRKGHSIPLSHATVRRHLEGALTIGLYAIDPSTQRCRWVAIDADYETALEDLLKLQWELRQNGVDAALEKSRRGGHLWIFAEEPLLARDCRIYIYNLASRLKVPVKGAGLADGIEVFPKQETLRRANLATLFVGHSVFIAAPTSGSGSTARTIHSKPRWTYLLRLKKITESDMTRFVQGLEMPPEFARKTKLMRAFSSIRMGTARISHPRLYRQKAKNWAGLLHPLPFLRATGARQKWRQPRHLHQRSAEISLLGGMHTRDDSGCPWTSHSERSYAVGDMENASRKH